ncbi:MAG: hypothetical protein ACRD0Z_12205 [Acidimicrobiales bacterium]
MSSLAARGAGHVAATNPRIDASMKNASQSSYLGSTRRLRLRLVLFAAMVTALAAVGVSAFTQPYGPTRNLVDIIMGFVVASAALGLRAASGRWQRRRLTYVLPFASVFG